MIFANKQQVIIFVHHHSTVLKQYCLISLSFGQTKAQTQENPSPAERQIDRARNTKMRTWMNLLMLLAPKTLCMLANSCSSEE
jgi:hypothetical protein